MLLPRSQNIMTRRQHLMLLSFTCVGCVFRVSTDHLSLTSFSVLNPQMKTKHFKKHWSTDLQDKVRDAAKEVVSLLTRVHFITISDINEWPTVQTMLQET